MTTINYSSIAFWYYLSALLLIVFRRFILFEYLFPSITLAYLFIIIWKKSNLKTFILSLLNIVILFLSLIRGINVELILIGTFSIFIYPIIFTLPLKNSNNRFYYLFKWFIILLALSTFIQFFYSKNLFGLLESTHYTTVGSRVTPRAVSIFAGSPQSTAFIAGTVLLFTSGSNHLKLNPIYRILLLFTGILTFSKIFVFFLTAILLVNLSTRIIFQSLKILFIIGISLPFAASMTNLDGINRLTNIIDTILNYNTYITFEIWVSQIKLNFKSIYNLLFGNGLGVLSRSNENIVNILGHYSSESYILQIYNEIGLLGAIILIVTLIYSMNTFYRKKMLALIIISVFSPSLYGITISFLVFGMILPISKIPFN